MQMNTQSRMYYYYTKTPELCHSKDTNRIEGDNIKQSNSDPQAETEVDNITQ